MSFKNSAHRPLNGAATPPVEDSAHLEPDAYRVAFSDSEFMARKETRGVRIQLEMLKPDLAQDALGVQNTVVVFGGARFCEQSQAQVNLERALESKDSRAILKAQAQVRNAHFYDKARRFGQLIGRYTKNAEPDKRLFIATGGGPGVMEAANRGASEEGAYSIGHNIVLPFEQTPNSYVTPELSFKFHYFAIRKMHLLMRAKALVAFPGGFGTLDEIFEVLTLIQCGKSKQVPVFLFGEAYWKSLVNMDFLLAEGAISPEDLSLFQYANEPEEVWDAIAQFYELKQ